MIEAPRLAFRIHAIRRMFERDISVADVRHVLATGDIIESYPEDQPYPSRLVLGFVDNRPLHVVAAYNEHENQIITITVYQPEADKWDETFRMRKP